MSLSSLPVGLACRACAGLSSFGAEWGIASEEGAVCPDPRAGPRRGLKNTAVQREGASAKQGNGVKKGRGTRCTGESVKMKWRRGGRTGEQENSRVPGFINQRRPKQNTHKAAWGQQEEI